MCASLDKFAIRWAAVILYVAAGAIFPAGTVVCAQDDGDFALMGNDGCIVAESCRDADHETRSFSEGVCESPCDDTSFCSDVRNLEAGSSIPDIKSDCVLINWFTSTSSATSVALYAVSHCGHPPPGIAFVRTVVLLN